MADLPPSRVAPLTPPFYFTYCDYFSPYSVRIGRNKTTKHYGVILTCLNTRAVHLDLAVDYSSVEFIQVLRRFFALRGVPSLMISDNGTQFVGAERQLREVIESWDKSKLREYSAEKGMQWQFTTPGAPHRIDDAQEDEDCALIGAESVSVTVTGIRDAYNKGLFSLFYLSNYVYCYFTRTIGQ